MTDKVIAICENIETMLENIKQQVAVVDRLLSRKLIDGKAATQILGISRPTLRKMVSDGNLACVSYGAKKSQYDYEEVMALRNNGIKNDIEK